MASSEKTTWMRGPSTPLRGALLGLLLERPGHGGDLASRLASRLGATWRVATTDVYRLLEQLERTGLAVSRSEPKRGNHDRTHLVYHPTDATATALTQWMETLLPREPVRLGLQAKLSVAREEDAPRLQAALQAYERECLALAEVVQPADGAARSWAALCIDCTRDAVHSQLRTEIEWAARTRARIDQHLAARALPRRRSVRGAAGAVAAALVGFGLGTPAVADAGEEERLAGSPTAAIGGEPLPGAG